MADGRYALVMLATHHSPFNAASQAPLQAAIEEAFAAANARHGYGLTLEHSAMARFALAAEQAMRADIGRISTVSLVGLGLLFLAMFRRPRLIALLLLPLALGELAALAVCLLLFGSVHGLTLAFGSTLIGVCIDYSVHLLNHHLLVPPHDGPDASARPANHDGDNDIFRPIAIGMRSIDLFRVYNRWGSMLYSGTGNGAGWDGNFGGRPQEAATYVWYAEGVDYLNNKIKRKGTVVLIR